MSRKYVRDKTNEEGGKKPAEGEIDLRSDCADDSIGKDQVKKVSYDELKDIYRNYDEANEELNTYQFADFYDLDELISQRGIQLHSQLFVDLS